MYENDLEAISRCFHMLDGMLQERKALLKGGNYEQYVQTNGVKLPAVFLLLDNYANFRDKTGNIYEELLIRLSRDAASCGIYFVISAAGFGLTELSNNIGKNIKTVITLELGDKFRYTDLLHTTRIPVLPEAGVKGRGLVRRGEQVLEYQTALSLEAEDDYSRIDRIAAECEKLNHAWKGKRAKAVPRIPEHPVIEDLYEREEVQELLADSYSLPVGYNVENAEPYCIDLRSTFSYLVSGKAKSGKKNLLKVLLVMAARKQIVTMVIDYSGK
ncbi:MAG: hypothetical protein LIP11_17850 [Clostridiales bacterium]|nr:hypothetical protein [Clostridiales bacterium]